MGRFDGADRHGKKCVARAFASSDRPSISDEVLRGQLFPRKHQLFPNRRRLFPNMGELSLRDSRLPGNVAWVFSRSRDLKAIRTVNAQGGTLHGDKYTRVYTGYQDRIVGQGAKMFFGIWGTKGSDGLSHFGHQ